MNGKYANLTAAIFAYAAIVSADKNFYICKVDYWQSELKQKQITRFWHHKSDDEQWRDANVLGEERENIIIIFSLLFAGMKPKKAGKAKKEKKGEKNKSE